MPSGRYLVPPQRRLALRPVPEARACNAGTVRRQGPQMTVHQEDPFSDVRCTRCGGARLFRKDGTIGVCSYIPCPSPLYDVERERGSKMVEPCEHQTITSQGRICIECPSTQSEGEGKP